MPKEMEIKTAVYVVSNTTPSRCPHDGRPEYAFIGRSNVGKSSLINMLAGRRKLAMTSATPGKTLLINHFLMNGEWYLVDLPGYGYARRDKRQQERLTKLIEDYVLERDELTCLFVLIDSRLEPQKIDLEFIEWLGENSVPFALVFTKADKNSRNVTQKNVQAFMRALKEQWEELPPHFVTSSAQGMGRSELLGYIEQVNRSLAAEKRQGGGAN